MSDERMLRCKLCRRDVPVTSMRFDNDGKNLVCRECLDSRDPKEKMRGSAGLQSTTSPKVRFSADNVTYKCSCGYTFQKRKGAILKRCPFCGREDIGEAKEPSADDLLKSLTEDNRE